MGARGPKPERDDGLHLTRKGYLRKATDVGRKLKLQHVLVWESTNGSVPDGYQVHHKNEDKTDNRLENLECLTPLEHKRKHSGCELRDGVWWKPCKVCNVFKPIDREHWYFDKRGYPAHGRCRVCHIARVVRDKQGRRARRRSAD